MRAKTILTIFLFTFLIAPLHSQSILVSFFDGEVEYRHGDGWELVTIGGKLAPGTEVRLGERAYLELLVDGSTLRYTRPGRYRLGTDGGDGAPTETNVRGLLRGKVSRLTGRERELPREATTGGVRASEAATEPELDWAGDETPEELIREGLSLLDTGEVEESSFVFEEAFDFSSGELRERSGFFLLYTLYLLDESDFARDILSELDPVPEAEYYVDYALIGAELYLQSGETERAASFLSSLLESRPGLEAEDPLSAQLVYYLYGLATEAADGERAAEYFQKAVAIAPSTAVAEEARRRGR